MRSVKPILAGHVTTYNYDANDHQILSTDPDGDVTLTCYDSDGDAAQTVPPDGVGADVTNASWSSGTATITADNMYVAGDTIVVSGVSPSGYNGIFTIATASSSQFTYSKASNPGSFSSSGTAELSGSSCPTTYPAGYGDRIAVDATTNQYDASGNVVVTTTPFPAGQSGLRVNHIHG